MNVRKSVASARKKLILLELNEFNLSLLEKAASALNLENLRYVLALPRTNTFTADTYESNFLEPWVQWVSIHTGRSSNEHRIQHLGDVPHLGATQIWEALSERGISSGVWGVMNGSRGTAKECRFFFPDPWTFSEAGYPEELSRMLELPRFLSKNYLSLSFKETFRRGLSFFLSLFRSGAAIAFAAQLPRLFADLVRHGPKHYVFIAHMDLLAAKLYARYAKRFSPDFGILFVNSIAHVQHHYWREDLAIERNPALHFTFRTVDRIVGIVRKTLGEDGKLLVLNGLSQKNTNDEPTWILYKIRDQKKFLDAVGIAFSSVEPHMTYDAHLFFASERERDAAASALRDARIGDRRLFLVETYPQDRRKLFYRIDFSDAVEKGGGFGIGGKELDFYSFFDSIVVRTGKHIPNGIVFGDFEELPKKMENHALYGRILKYFEA
jgi:hypothetical protein